MNIIKQAEKLEKFLDEEFSKNIPLLVLPDKSLVYKTYKVKQNKQGNWDLRHAKNNDFVDQFKTKTAAIIAAKFYHHSNFNRYHEIKHLDLHYWNNSQDAMIFKYRVNTTKDLDRRDIFQWRFEITNNRAKHYKSQITQMFKSNF